MDWLKPLKSPINRAREDFLLPHPAINGWANGKAFFPAYPTMNGGPNGRAMCLSIFTDPANGKALCLSICPFSTSSAIHGWETEIAQSPSPVNGASPLA